MKTKLNQTIPSPTTQRRRSVKITLRLAAFFCLIVLLASFVVIQRGRNTVRYDRIIWETANRHDVDPYLVKAVIRQESRFNPNARGKAGEVGLMQITEGAVADWKRVNGRTVTFPGGAFDPQMNIEIGTWYLARACSRWRTHPKTDVLALSQYNAGPTRARRWAKLPDEKLLAAIPIASTRSYIVNVLAFRDEFSSTRTANNP